MRGTLAVETANALTNRRLSLATQPPVMGTYAARHTTFVALRSGTLIGLLGMILSPT